MPALTLDRLTKVYSRNSVPLRELSLTVAEGEFLTLLGPSGCGKSTTLRLIAGLDSPTGGQIRVGDRDVTELSPQDRNVAMVFQSYALYPHMSVFENIASPLQQRRLPKPDIETRVLATAVSLGLKELLQRRPGQLSGGQRQRVALARALVREPDVFLLDEPLSNLDASLREQVRGELKALFSRQNAPVVYVTHDQVEAMSLSQRVAILSGGHLQQLDEPSRIYQRPANAFVAGFIGSPRMNLLSLPCSQGEISLGALRLPAPPAAGGRVMLGLRPEHCHLPPRPQDCSLSGHIQLVEYQGMHNLVSLSIDGLEEPWWALVAAGIPLGGDRPTIGFDPADLHWFDASSGQRLDH
jgi:multiple sugar transport system ATP-binding protein